MSDEVVGLLLPYQSVIIADDSMYLRFAVVADANGKAFNAPMYVTGIYTIPSNNIHMFRFEHDKIIHEREGLFYKLSNFDGSAYRNIETYYVPIKFDDNCDAVRSNSLDIVKIILPGGFTVESPSVKMDLDHVDNRAYLVKSFLPKKEYQYMGELEEFEDGLYKLDMGSVEYIVRKN